MDERLDLKIEGYDVEIVRDGPTSTSVDAEASGSRGLLLGTIPFDARPDAVTD